MIWLLLVACAVRAPEVDALSAWKRARLLSPVMQGPDPLEAGFEVHVHTTREAASGAEPGGGTSCGCN